MIFLFWISLLPQMILAQRSQEPIGAVVFFIRDSNNKVTGEYFIVYCHTKEELDRSKPNNHIATQAKLQAAGKKHEGHWAPIEKGGCGIIYNYTTSQGVLRMGCKVVKESSEVTKEEEILKRVNKNYATIKIECL